MNEVAKDELTVGLESESGAAGSTEEAVLAFDVASGEQEPGSRDAVAESEQVPVWLAALVLVLLLAVMGVGGFALRGLVESGPRATSAVDLEIAKWQDAVKLNSDDVGAHLSLGFAYQQAERYDDALEQYDWVVARTPKDTAALYNRGIVLFALGRDKEAEEALWDVLEVEPGHVLAAKALGEYYADEGEYRSLIEAVRPVVEKTESAADLQYLMGLAYEHLGREDWARVRYRLALKYYPDMPEAKEGLERLGVEQ